MKQLERLLFLQGHRCFFCGQAIPTGQASIEHLVATSNGGANEDENCVVCCKILNAALGHLSVKAKLQVVLNQRGSLSCPMSAEVLAVPSEEPGDDRVAVAVADLRKRGSARPRRVTTLKNTLNAAFRMALSDAEVDALLSRLVAKGYVSIEDTKVTYALPATGA